MDSPSSSRPSAPRVRPRRSRKKAAPKDSDVPAAPGWGPSTFNSQAAPDYSNFKVADSSSAFERGDEFIAFESSSRSSSPPAPPTASGPAQVVDTGRMRQPLHLGQKRRWESDTLDRNDGYASKKSMVDAALRKAPWAADVAWEDCNNVAEMLHEEVKAFVNYISPTPVEHEVRSRIVQLISDTIRKNFQDAVILPFGSFETKLYLPLGDIDLVVQSEMMAEYDKDQILRYLAGVLRRAGITERVTVIAKAKVPIVKFVTTHGRFSVDISINQTNGVAAGKMVNQFLKELPALRSLVLIVKSFLNQRSMNEVFSGGLGSYSIVCLAISFLQLHPKIRRGEIDPSRNLGVLAMEFFELYGRCFNYERTGISIRHGGSYYSKMRKGWFDVRKPTLLSIEDPGDITNDISRGSFNINHVRQTFAGAYEILSTTAYLRAAFISSRRRGEYVNLRERGQQLQPEAMSILSSIMGVTQETINHRRCVEELYDSGVVHSLLGMVGPRQKLNIPLQRSWTAAEQRQSVVDAWKEAEGSDEPSETPQGFRQDSEKGPGTRSALPPKKRRKVGGLRDTHTVFLTDDDDDEGPESSDASHDRLVGEQLEREEGEYVAFEGEQNIYESQTAHERKESQDTRSVRIDRKRAYWAAKAAELLRDSS